MNRRWQATDELIDEITGAAERIAAARTWGRDPVCSLGDHEMATVIHVLRVIRQRLERDARERTSGSANYAGPGRGRRGSISAKVAANGPNAA